MQDEHRSKTNCLMKTHVWLWKGVDELGDLVDGSGVLSELGNNEDILLTWLLWVVNLLTSPTDPPSSVG